MDKGYNQLPVYYCAECRSLHILRTQMGRGSLSYCGKCGNTAIVKTDIFNYLKLLENGRRKD